MAKFTESLENVMKNSGLCTSEHFKCIERNRL